MQESRDITHHRNAWKRLQWHWLEWQTGRTIISGGGPCLLVILVPWTKISMIKDKIGPPRPFSPGPKFQWQDPVTRDMLTYCRLIIREALRHITREALRQRHWGTCKLQRYLASVPVGVYIALLGIDPTISQCALSVMQQPLITQPSMGTGRAYFSGWQPLKLLPIYSSWNLGRCIYPGTCLFRHVCATCGQRHQVRDCADTPPDSPYRRSPRIRGST